MALSVTGLTKHYDSGFTLDDVTFDLPSGYIMGLVGPNGAGKSTLIKLILNMTTRDAGRIEVLGLDAMADEERAKEQLGVVLDSSYFIEYMTVDAVERTSSPMYPLWDHNLFDAYLRRFGLGRNKKIKDLSRGMQMKLMLAVALSHDAKLLILDEPTSGLDVLSRDELMDILSDYVADGGHSVIFSTHITADLERCADFLAYITNGMLYYSGPKDEFEDAFRLVKGGPDELTDSLQRAMAGIVPINRNHQILGRFAFLIACDLVAGLEVAVSIACAGTIMHEPVKVTDAIDFAAMTVLTLVLLNAIVQPFLYRFSPYRAMAAIILSIGVIVGTVIGLRKALPEFEKTVEQLAEAISRHQAIALATFLIIDVLALVFSSKISLHIYGSKDI